MRKRRAGSGWVLDVGLALAALVVVTCSLTPREAVHGPLVHLPAVGVSPGLAVSLPADAVDDAESSDRMVLVAYVREDDASATLPHIRVARHDVEPHGPVAFPLSTPLRGPPRA